ncbi:PAS domain S-box-containing protein/diguanylate cyclase (GGDEF)-like protein [Hypnocyclicus thermotrophus]|uniref:PAS domain S-box-containing protein/diguanylate cyclase (GGDEF)-like protein n=1 Tax=Hypnocyclicus thermotrophus TaxID=1627895 RepID=A0AA46E029_9FUSO|nr:sensor domain-containing diguanylate cyclase [Hypnocyclicus thermotrophus]TDT72271.1 PAS domain S-box-containing protein/diguanylate cyclase (GGDEF)-like protein [Hypnocyclicus thermotrophus]
MIENFPKEILEKFYEGIYFVDNNRKILYWNKGAEDISGYKAEEVINKHCFDNILMHVDNTGNQLCKNGCPLHKTLQDHQYRETKVYLHHKNGHRVPVYIRTFPMFDNNNQIIGALEIFSDASFQKEILKKLKKLIMIDKLTGIPNRRYFEAQFDSKLLNYKKTNIKFAIAILDIDQFKKVNDIYGHDVGDKILKIISNTLISNIEPTEVVARFGGEEFMLLLNENNLDKLIFKIDKIRTLIENSGFKVKKDEKEFEVKVTVTIGATIIEKNDDFDSVYSKIDKFLYEGKNSGRNISIVK